MQTALTTIQAEDAKHESFAVRTVFSSSFDIY